MRDGEDGRPAGGCATVSNCALRCIYCGVQIQETDNTEAASKGLIKKKKRRSIHPLIYPEPPLHPVMMWILGRAMLQMLSHVLGLILPARKSNPNQH